MAERQRKNNNHLTHNNYRSTETIPAEAVQPRE